VRAGPQKLCQAETGPQCGKKVADHWFRVTKSPCRQALLTTVGLAEKHKSLNSRKPTSGERLNSYHCSTFSDGLGICHAYSAMILVNKKKYTTGRLSFTSWWELQDCGLQLPVWYLVDTNPGSLYL